MKSTATTSRPDRPSRLRLAVGLREAWRSKYTAADLRSDFVAGVVTGLVALPLSMALAIAVGLPPRHGLYTAIVAGSLIALLGGTRTSVSGPTAAFVVLLAPVTAQYGPAGLLLATLMAGVMLIVMGLARLGGFIQFVPHPVTTGFTSGIAVVIATLQIKDLLGLTVERMPDHFPARVAALAAALPTVHWPDLAIGGGTLAILVLWPRITRRIPASLIALGTMTLVAWAVHEAVPAFEVETIHSRFGSPTGGESGIPRTPPLPDWPWSWPGGDGQPLVISMDLLRHLAMPALAIAMLGAIESLLCAVVADGMTGRKHDPDAELLAQGIGNVVAPFFGGFAATAAIARTATGIRAGARSPIASFIHAVFVLLAVLALAPVLEYLPMAALAALLIIVAWTMSDVRHFLHTLHVAPRSDVVVLLVCFTLTVVFDMVVSVTAGVMLSALLFMKRMSDLSSVRLADGRHPELLAPLPDGVLLYEIAGPLFFGAAEKAAGALNNSAGRAKAVILYMGAVPTIDMTGLVALESAIRKLQAGGAMVMLAAVQPAPLRTLIRAGLRPDPGRLSICQSLPQAEMLARLLFPGASHSEPQRAA